MALKIIHVVRRVSEITILISGKNGGI